MTVVRYEDGTCDCIPPWTLKEFFEKFPELEYILVESEQLITFEGGE